MKNRNTLYKLLKRRQNSAVDLFSNTELLGYIFSYASQVIDYLKENFGKNILTNLGLNEDQTKKAAEILATIYQSNQSGLKRGQADALAVRDLAARNLAWTDTTKKAGLLKLILFMNDINASNEPLLNDWLAGKVGLMSYVLDFGTGAKKIASNITEGTKDTFKEAGQAIAKGAGSALEIANENLPFYLKPKILIPGAIALLALMYLPKKKNT
jgi:hypothetical protein